MQWSRRHLRWRRIAEIMCYSATNGGLSFHERMDEIVFTCAQGNSTRIVVLFRETASVDASWLCGEVAVVVESWKLSVTLMKCLLLKLFHSCVKIVLIWSSSTTMPDPTQLVLWLTFLIKITYNVYHGRQCSQTLRPLNIYGINIRVAFTTETNK